MKGNLAGYGYDHAQWKDQTRVCGYNNVRRYQAWTPYNVIGMGFYRDDWWNSRRPDATVGLLIFQEC
ncbi:MAG: hypothetical protein QM742_18795 [Aquabacterium sp.]